MAVAARAVRHAARAPHCQGTHTECVGHATLNGNLLAGLTPVAGCLAVLVAVEPVALGDVPGTDAAASDRVITRAALAAHRVYRGLSAGSVDAATAVRGHALVTERAYVADAAFDGLRRRGILPDWREPDVIRATPVPFDNRYGDAWRCVDALCAELR